MNTKAIFPSGKESNLILGISTENQIFFLRTPAAVKFFSPNCQKMTIWLHWGMPWGMLDAPHDGGHPLISPVMGVATDTPMTIKQL